MEIRPFDETDSVESLTDLLHGAYAQHAAEGRRFFASYQSVDDTRRRIGGGDCWLAVHDDAIIGTVTIRARHSPPAGYPGPAMRDGKLVPVPAIHAFLCRRKPVKETR